MSSMKTPVKPTLSATLPSPYNEAAMPLSKATIKNMLDRPARLRGLALLALLLSVLAILGGMIGRNLGRLDTIQGYVSYSHKIQEAGLDLQQALVDVLSEKGVLDAAQLNIVAGKIRVLAAHDAHLSPQTPAKLELVNAALARADATSADNGKAELFDALRSMHEILDEETEQRELVLEEISRDTLSELELATGTLTAILLLAWFFLRRRILAPLHDLKQLLLNLAKEDYSPIETRGLDPLLLPVFNSYNVMVTHLSELEESKRMYAEALEAEVRTATQALLEQQSSLARAERLAAVGELSASVAHELRNPLAGIQMSCANLREDTENPDQAERLDLIGAELKRMARLLNELLDQSRQTPTPATDFNLAALVRDLVALTHYQIPRHIALTYDIPAGLECHLPESNLRQALLNLILNAAQAIDDKPGSVSLRASRGKDAICIEVADDGPGFCAEMLNAGIRPFSTGRAGGTGLGLAIVQRFARDVGGRLELANLEPRGACVRLLLPCRSRS